MDKQISPADCSYLPQLVQHCHSLSMFSFLAGERHLCVLAKLCLQHMLTWITTKGVCN